MDLDRLVIEKIFDCSVDLLIMDEVVIIQRQHDRGIKRCQLIQQLIKYRVNRRKLQSIKHRLHIVTDGRIRLSKSSQPITGKPGQVVV